MQPREDRRHPPVARAPRPVLSAAGFLACLVIVAIAGALPGGAARASADTRPGPLVLDEPPQPLVPRQPLDGAAADRLEAKKLYASARLLERRDDLPGALRAYQRALRLDPQASSIVQEIVALAFRLKRPEMAMRYAVKATEVRDGEALLPLLLKLGAYLAEEGDWRRAAAIYERIRAVPPGAQGDRRDKAARLFLDLELGRLYHLLGDHDKAAPLFAGVMEAEKQPEKSGLDKSGLEQLRKDAALNYRLFGESFLQAGRFERAAEAFRTAQAAKPDETEHRYQQARLKAKTGRPQEALADLQVYFDRRASGEGVGPYELLADLLTELKQQADLLPRLERLRQADPQNVPLRYFLAGRYRQAGQWSKAETLYRELAGDKPAAGVYQGLVTIYRRTGRVDPLLATLGEILAKGTSLEPLAAEAQAITDDASLMNGLIEGVRRQHRANAAEPPYGARLAVALLALQDRRYEAAEELFDLAIAARPKQAAELLLVWGSALLADERPADAVRVFQRGARYKLTPGNQAAVAFYLAGALALAGRTDPALEMAQQAAKLRKDSARIVGRHAWVLFHAKRYDDARKAYLDLLQRFDDNYRSEENRRALREARLLLSNIDALQNRSDSAEEWLEQVLDEYPDDVSALNDLGYLWAERGVKLHRAVAMLQHAVAEEPENAAFRDSLGWVYFRQGKFAAAVAELEKAASLAEKPDGVIYDHLGDALARDGRRDKALAAWRKAAELFRKENDTEKLGRVQRKIDGRQQP